MKRFLLFFTMALALLAASTDADARSRYKGTIYYTQTNTEKIGQTVVISTVMDLTELHLRRQQMVIVTPMLISSDGKNRHDLAPVAITGRTRHIMVNRAERFHDEIFTTEPTKIVRHVNNPRRDADMIELLYEIRYEEWMRDANLIIDEAVSGCANCSIEESQFVLKEQILPPLFIPQYNVVYVTPPIEEIKQRSDSYSARLNFMVNKYDIRRDLGDNAARLDDIDRIFREVNEDKNLTLTEVNITGFASPEGNFDSNMVLSKNRAQSLANYLSSNHNVPSKAIKVSWMGEDWEGLRKLVAETNFDGRDAVLAAIDNSPNIAQRKSRINGINGGRTFRYMLENLYPQLRRNDYTISYIARPFDVEEARQVIRVNPRHLSLNEMFHVAKTYEKGSEGFNQVFDIAVRLYPDNDIAKINAAAAEIENGAVDMAIRRLSSINSPEAWNNLGVAYAARGDYQKAEEYFRKAAQAGNKVASDNLRQMDLWKQSN